MDFPILSIIRAYRFNFENRAIVAAYRFGLPVHKITYRFLVRFYHSPLEVQYMFQELRLKHLLLHVRRTTYWHNILPTENSLKALSKIPILSRDKIRKHHILAFNSMYDEETISTETSGTSGPSLVINHDKRTLWWRGFSTPFWFFSLGFSPFQHQNALLSLSGAKPWNRWFGRRISVQQLLTHPQELVQLIKKERTKAIFGKVSDVFRLVEIWQREQISRQLCFIFTDGELLTAQTRRWFEDVLGGTSYHKYASAEFGNIGKECKLRNGYHIDTDRLIVEITDPAGNSLSPGEIGNITITALDNAVFPLIRYVIGDRGYIETSPCACGFRTPRLYVLCREIDYIELPTRRLYLDEIAKFIDAAPVRLRHWWVETDASKIRFHIVPVKMIDLIGIQMLQKFLTRNIYDTGADSPAIAVVLESSIRMAPNNKALLIERR